MTSECFLDIMRAPGVLKIVMRNIYTYIEDGLWWDLIACIAGVIFAAAAFPN